jgi:hypothetical protein
LSFKVVSQKFSLIFYSWFSRRPTRSFHLFLEKMLSHYRIEQKKQTIQTHFHQIKVRNHQINYLLFRFENEISTFFHRLLNPERKEYFMFMILLNIVGELLFYIRFRNSSSSVTISISYNKTVAIFKWY